MTRRTAFLRLFSFTALLALPAMGAAMPFHLHLEKSSPADASVVEAPKSVQLWFSAQTELAVTRVTVKDAKGLTVQTAPVRRGTEPKAPVEALFLDTVAPGAYTVEWRTMSADGHVVKGMFSFTVKAPGKTP